MRRAKNLTQDTASAGSWSPVGSLLARSVTVLCPLYTGHYWRPGESAATKSKQWDPALNSVLVISSSIFEDLLYARPCLRHWVCGCELQEAVGTHGAHALVVIEKGHFWELRIDFTSWRVAQKRFFVSSTSRLGSQKSVGFLLFQPLHSNIPTTPRQENLLTARSHCWSRIFSRVCAMEKV